MTLNQIMNDSTPHPIIETRLKAEFSIRYSYNIDFTHHLFMADNPLVRKFFMDRFREENQISKVLVMIDQGVTDHFPGLIPEIEAYFRNIQAVELVQHFYIFPGGEKVKNERETHEKMLRAIDLHKIDRHSWVIAIGGGAFLDAVGYAAAISHRGVRHIRIPTTVLSQNDSGIGVKNGINYFHKKNYLGSFTPPNAVWNDARFLQTLSDRDKRAGLAEAVKVALIRDASFFYWLEDHASRLSRFEEESLQSSIIQCARLHLNHIITSGDPFEKGSARPLDFGHWAAHKLEDLTQYDIRHGEAVAVGIVLDTIYSGLMGYIDETSVVRIRNLFDDLGFAPSFKYLNQINSTQLLVGLEEFREHLGGQLTITLLRSVGQGFEVNEIDRLKMEQAIQLLSTNAVKHGN